MKSRRTGLLAAVAFLVGGAMMCYPYIAKYWNSRHQTQVIAGYSKSIEAMKEEETSKMLSEAEYYNARLSAGGLNCYPGEEQTAEYERLLNVGGDGIMGCIAIPSLSLELPIYHGTDDGVLQAGIGHLEWSSLPVGGEGTHSVLTGHCGMADARLFTDLEKLDIGDVFSVTVPGAELTYEVDKISVVTPDNISALQIENGRDLCTLVTCTPYGVNTHRLLVRGTRIENGQKRISPVVLSEGEKINPSKTALFLAFPSLGAILFLEEAVRRGRRAA